MRLAKIQFHKLDKEYYFLPEFSEDQRYEVKVHDAVITDSLLGRDLGVVVEVHDHDEAEVEKIKTAQIKSVGDFKLLTRLARTSDLDKIKANKANYIEYLKTARELCQKHQLKEMKLIDLSESLDNSHLSIYFTSNVRVDFRDLVRDLAAMFHKKIRLQQIGVRDAAKIGGDLGSCGLPLCCKAWLLQIGKVSPDCIKKQELAHRGVDRLTGVCGRLKCCLRFEEENFRFAEGENPKVGDSIKTKIGTGKVVEVCPDKKILILDIKGAKVEYPYAEGNKCKSDCKSDDQTGCGPDCK